MGSKRLALIGAGRMGRVHLDALERSRVVDLAGVVEPVEQTRETVAARGHLAYATVDQLLADQHPDGVVIAAPTGLHRQLVCRFAEQGVPILCEKPAGRTPADADAAVSAARDARVLLQVGYWRRFVPALRELRERIAGGAVGDISLIACHQWDQLPPSEEFRAGSGGIAVDMAVHEFDQARWLTRREVRSVAAVAGGAGGSPGDPDAAAILAELSGGVAAVISLGRRFPHGDCCWLEVFGSDGYERLPFMWGSDGARVFRAAVLAQLEAFAAAIDGAEQRGADGQDAIAALSAAAHAGAALTEARSVEVAV